MQFVFEGDTRFRRRKQFQKMIVFTATPKAQQEENSEEIFIY
jgi:hypothetical protein